MFKMVESELKCLVFNIPVNSSGRQVKTQRLLTSVQIGIMFREVPVMLLKLCDRQNMVKEEKDHYPSIQMTHNIMLDSRNLKRPSLNFLTMN